MAATAPANIGTASLFVTVESQIRYLIGMLRAMRREGVAALEVRPEAERGFRARAAARTAGSVVNTGGCRTWYLDRRRGRRRPGSYQARSAAVATLLACAYAVGLCGTALRLAVDHAKSRVQFGRPIGAFQSVANRCADMRVETDPSAG